VREAIRQLAASGLVRLRPHRGAEVALPDQRQLDDMFAAMAELEALCAGLSAQNMSASERRNLESIQASLGALVREGDHARYHTVNEAFHGAIYVGAHNGYLSEITFATRQRVSPFRRAQFRTLGRLSQSYLEHERVVQAILRGDRAAAAEAMRSHIGIVRGAYGAYSRRT
jgi:DNA-binding GntR family transcriptional regulator